MKSIEDVITFEESLIKKLRLIATDLEKSGKSERAEKLREILGDEKIDTGTYTYGDVVGEIEEAILTLEAAIAQAKIYEETVDDLEVLISDFADISSISNQLATTDMNTFNRALELLGNTIKIFGEMGEMAKSFSKIKETITEREVSEEDRKRIFEETEATMAKLYAEGKLAPEKIEVIVEDLEKKGEVERAKRLREILKSE